MSSNLPNGKKCSVFRSLKVLKANKVIGQSSDRNGQAVCREIKSDKWQTTESWSWFKKMITFGWLNLLQLIAPACFTLQPALAGQSCVSVSLATSTTSPHPDMLDGWPEFLSHKWCCMIVEQSRETSLHLERCHQNGVDSTDNTSVHCLGGCGELWLMETKTAWTDHKSLIISYVFLVFIWLVIVTCSDSEVLTSGQTLTRLTSELTG